MPGPLEGVRVLDISEIIAGPYCGMLLADMGAEVVKLEPPGGEPWRLFAQFVPGESTQYISLNRGKKSLVLDLRRPESRPVVERLARWADVVVVNLRPDVPAKYEVDYESLSAVNPRLIYCVNTAFGRRGPDAQRPGYDIVVQAVSGLLAAEGKLEGDVPQIIMSTAIADYATGIAMAWAICAALYDRERTGRGQCIDTSLLNTALHFQGGSFTIVEAAERERRKEFLRQLAGLRERGGSFAEQVQLHRSLMPYFGPGDIYYRAFRTQDSAIVVGCLAQPLRRKFAVLLGVEDLRLVEESYDPLMPGVEEFGPRLKEKAEAVLKTKTTAEWLTILDGAGVPAGPVRFVDELEDDPQVRANNLVVELEHHLVGTVRMPAPLAEMSGTPLEARTASPILGEHTDEVLSSLGYDGDEIRSLRQQAVVA